LTAINKDISLLKNLKIIAMKTFTKNQLTFKGVVRGKYAKTYIGENLYMYIPSKYVIIADQNTFVINENIYNNIQNELLYKTK